MAKRRQSRRNQMAEEEIARLSDEDNGHRKVARPRDEHDDDNQRGEAIERPSKKHRPLKQDASEEARRKSFALLRPRVQYVSSRVIQNKWDALPIGVQDRVKDLLRSIERPAISSATRWEVNGNPDGKVAEQKRVFAQDVIGDMRRRLIKRLPEMVFPPKTREADFDHEAALLENRNLEAQLAATTGSIDLLRAEVERQKSMLAKETKSLESLKANAQSAATERKRLAKRTHPKIQDIETCRQRAVSPHLPANATFTVPSAHSLLCDIDENDPDLYPIVRQLRRHLDSMRQNHSQIGDMKIAVGKAKAVVDSICQKWNRPVEENAR
ncbi:hypothetical protein KEM54_004577 [Ascosphaera aggregata]|nr:hypothetical protein KEM54_004577 [Ascosphaera aggregata]